MNEPPNNPNSSSGRDKEMKWNRFWLLVGFSPFLFSFSIAMPLHKPQLFLAPLYGFCPLDFLHIHSSPPPEQILLWGCASAIICIAFSIYAFFVRPFGILFALVMWASTIGLFFRIVDAAKGIQ